MPLIHSVMRPPAMIGVWSDAPRPASAPDSACTRISVTGRSAYGPVRPYGVIDTSTSPGSRSRRRNPSNTSAGEPFEHDVGRRDQVEDRGIVGRAGHRAHAVMQEAEQRRALVGVDGRAAGGPRAPRIAVGRLDLDHVGARLGEQVRAVRAGDADGEVEHSQVREPGQSFRHVRKKSSSRGVQCVLTDGNMVQPCGASG